MLIMVINIREMINFFLAITPLKANNLSCLNSLNKNKIELIIKNEIGIQQKR